MVTLFRSTKTSEIKTMCSNASNSYGNVTPEHKDGEWNKCCTPQAARTASKKIYVKSISPSPYPPFLNFGACAQPFEWSKLRFCNPLANGRDGAPPSLNVDGLQHRTQNLRGGFGGLEDDVFLRAFYVCLAYVYQKGGATLLPTTVTKFEDLTFLLIISDVYFVIISIDMDSHRLIWVSYAYYDCYLIEKFSRNHRFWFC